MMAIHRIEANIADLLLFARLGDVHLGMSIEAFDALLHPLPGAGADPIDSDGEQGIQCREFYFTFRRGILGTIKCYPTPGAVFPHSYGPTLFDCDFGYLKTGQSPDEFTEAVKSFCSPARDESWLGFIVYRTSERVTVWFDEDYDFTPHRFKLEVIRADLPEDRRGGN